MASLNPLSNASGHERKSVSYDPSSGKEYINIMALPEDLQKHMQGFDANGDGIIMVDELAQLARVHKQSDETSRTFKRLTLFLSFLMMLLVLCSFGLSFAVYELTRDTMIEDHRLTSLDHETVQTASNDTMIDNVTGTMLNRGTGAPVRTADSPQHITLDGVTSAFNNDFFAEMKSLDLTDAIGNTIFFQITGFTRHVYNSDADLANSTVTLYTDAGKVYLTNHTWEFDENSEIAELMHSYGWDTESGTVPGRRILFFSTVVNATGGAIVGAMVGSAVCALTAGLGCLVAASTYLSVGAGVGAVGAVAAGGK
mmetsp:Transcript_31979/g.38678  ORF Transcript_31979/g.38678 Transcript_31979/m.38678 type:complete len:312 (+) Transcript_31979:156-1091(+)|eukprot:CAMPEP_0197853332 /NCGR_PEP_ID=MMETSP1438-20131217/22536_1 /TAXON_ID=1461541 /ORGANISM="Pterosperma sp., Strain CCMP1384" /LENGTH=311 /DNA_ID=CAMNT_0043467705 /DNA_START=128 /DNA_END=1063 /DNA_ORIENTATION=+